MVDPASGRRICLFWQTPAGCRKGDDCPFAHVRANVPQVPIRCKIRCVVPDSAGLGVKMAAEYCCAVPYVSAAWSLDACGDMTCVAVYRRSWTRHSAL